MRRALMLSMALGAALMLPSATMAASTIDQSNDPASAAWGFGTPLTPPAALAQVFTAGRTGPLTAVSVFPSGNGLGKVGVHLEIRDVSAGHPGTTILATASISTNVHDKFVKIALHQAPAVSAGVQYAILVVYDTTTGSALAGKLGDPYAGGGGWTSFGLTNWDPTTGTEVVDFDFAFRTYVG